MGSLLVPVRQRRTFRHAVRVQCQVVRERDFKLLGEETLDMSTGGMLVMTHERVLTGEDVIVSFAAPGLRTWFDAEATIARVVHGRRGTDTARALGIRFSRLDRVSKTYLKEGLHRFPPILQAREPRIDYAESVMRIWSEGRTHA
jgi:c-di-GMP-binding flagellar brake protein YcgR